MPKELKQRIEDYFQTSWSLNRGIDIYEVSQQNNQNAAMFYFYGHFLEDFKGIS